MSKLSRREFLAAMMAGGVVVAGKLWMPGEKVISIPKPQIFANDNFSYNHLTRMVEVIKHDNRNVAAVSDLYDFLNREVAKAFGIPGDDLVLGARGMGEGIHGRYPEVILPDGLRVSNPEYMTHGSLIQESEDGDGSDQFVGVSTVGHMPTDDSIHFQINGQPAVHPGPVEQLVRANAETKIQLRAEQANAPTLFAQKYVDRAARNYIPVKELM